MQIKPLFPELANKERPLLIAGPCSAETQEQMHHTAQLLKEMEIDVFRAGIWKPRTKPGSFEGVGEQGLYWLNEIQQAYDLKVATEVATPHHIEMALKHNIDLLWIGARTVTNPFAMQAIAQALKGCDVPILVKNPVNPDIELWIGGLERLNIAGIERLGAIHRGFSSYKSSNYRNMPLWNIPIELKRRLPELPIFCDPSHIGGKRELIAPLAQEAMELQMDGLFIESHCNPLVALSDKNQQITPLELKEIIGNIVVGHSDQNELQLHQLRLQIDAIDQSLLDMLKRRMDLSLQIGQYKKEHQLTIFQNTRYQELLNQRESWAEEVGLNIEFAKNIVEEIHQESIRLQMEHLKK